MRTETVYLSLGSNMGRRSDYLAGALEGLRQQPRISVDRVSSLYETEPQDVRDQPWFLNLAASITTDLTPQELLAASQEMEREAGRVQTADMRRGPRPLDIDILLYGSIIMDTPELTVPHPRMTERRFVLEPLLEIAPDLVFPRTGARLAGYLHSVRDQALRPISRLYES